MTERHNYYHNDRFNLSEQEYPLSYKFYREKDYFRVRLNWDKHPLHNKSGWCIGEDYLETSGFRSESIVFHHYLIVWDGTEQLSSIHKVHLK